MKPAACSWRVSTSSMRELRRDSTTSRFSSPGMPKMRSTPSFSSAATRRSEPLVVMKPAQGIQAFMMHSAHELLLEGGDQRLGRLELRDAGRIGKLRDDQLPLVV